MSGTDDKPGDGGQAEAGPESSSMAVGETRQAGFILPGEWCVCGGGEAVHLINEPPMNEWCLWFRCMYRERGMSPDLQCVCVVLHKVVELVSSAIYSVPL